DPAAQLLYVSNSSQIQLFDLSSETLTPLLSFEGGPLALDVERNRLYWAHNSAGTSAIKWIDLAMPAAPQSVITGISGGVGSLYLDGPNDQIYWTETVSHNIQRADLIGQNQNIVTISSGLPGSCGDSGAPLALTVDSAGGHLYWTQINGLYRAALAPGSAAQGVIGSNGCTTLSTGGGIALGYASIPATPTPTHTPTATSTPTETPTPT